MIAWLDMLGKPAAYLAVRHPQKPTFDWFVPIGLTCVSTAVYVWLPTTIPFIGQNSLTGFIQELVKMLSGFFIAALAAIATFKDDQLDKYMIGDPPTLTEYDAEKSRMVERALTRRRFLSLLFGYLAFISLMLFVWTVALAVVKDTAIASLGAWTPAARIATVAFTLFWFWNMFSVALLGLYYLTYRMHRPDQRMEAEARETARIAALGAKNETNGAAA